MHNRSMRTATLPILAVVTMACVEGGGVAEEPRVVDSSVTDVSVAETTIFPVDDAIADYGVEEVEIADAAPGATTITLTIDGTECKSITCPAGFPYVVGCAVSLSGSSNQVCIVHVAGSPTVIFKEGQACGSTSVRGTVTCSTDPGAPLDTSNCRVNKTKPLYITSLGACPG